MICPVPLTDTDTVLLGHGSGGKLSAELLRNLFLPALANPTLSRLEDQAVLDFAGRRLAFTTDSFVVKPLFFRGGDIGSLAVHGTVNDLAVGGARPLALSAAFILEEGFPLADLRRIADSMAQAAAAAGVCIVTADTKVVERGSGDGVYINTAGIGIVAEGVYLSAASARPGDAVILSGAIGDHGAAILTQREGLELDGALQSDSAPLHTLVEAILAVSHDVRAMRDPTRGGLASTLNEIAAQSKVGIVLREEAIPIHEGVRGACELLGLDPLYVANEGKLVAIVPPGSAGEIVAAMRRHPLGAEAAVIGAVAAREPGLVTMRTAFGTSRIVDMLAGGQLPRIC
ncbi:MAG TPA: hydrogenase expression/formation protein HypE [Candidatus Sulfopaludibacter sp.]|nr:hydrogenase expression/formation protein HypE [Candidatus Sulfopaludibacter sp.]